ncbi:hypothetical protein [Fluviicola sp.]|uniref:hypothetical protein n=1 Tax=Fluviicola sp. TaxID=1917219 RepID=UPI0031D9AA21
MYKEQFLMTLKDGIYPGGVEHSELRSLYDNILKTFVRTGVYQNGTEQVVYISEVDEAFVRMRTMECLASTSRHYRAYDYDKALVLETICDHVAAINAKIEKDNREADEATILSKKPVPERYSIIELRKAGNLQ